ncbi:hypothetical protein DRP98_05105 [candidate division KSB1 bacterium]|nr:MAG: hypothetical protein DRP98_05105 [candidate division KSB1 bacterium]RKY89166.1 MAG: hypothetical protein DRQ11_01755 [candidate division KSB1 bacterium]
MKSWLIWLIIFAGLLFSITITSIIAHQIKKTFSAKYQKYFYLLIALYPLIKILQSFGKQGFTLSDPFMFFWFVFWIFCLVMFFKTNKHRTLQHPDNQKRNVE